MRLGAKVSWAAALGLAAVLAAAVPAFADSGSNLNVNVQGPDQHGSYTFSISDYHSGDTVTYFAGDEHGPELGSCQGSSCTFTSNDANSWPVGDFNVFAQENDNNDIVGTGTSSNQCHHGPPPGQMPEVPYAALLPVAGIGAALVIRRLRTRPS